MRASSKRILSIALATIFLLASLLVYGNLIHPEIRRVAQKRGVIVAKQNLFNNQQAAVNQVQDLLGQFENVTRLQEALSLAMPSNENLTQILNQMETITRINNVLLSNLEVKVLAFRPATQPLAKRLGTLRFNLAIIGSYEGIKGFLRSLETNARVVNLVEFIIQSFGEESSQGFYSTNLTVDVYYQSD